MYRVRDGYLVRSSLIVVDAEVKCSPTNDSESARDTLALCPALLIVCCEMFLFRRSACGGKGVDAEPEGVGVETDGGWKLCGDATCESKVSIVTIYLHSVTLARALSQQS